MKTILSVNSKTSQKDSQKVIEKVMEIGQLSKYSGPLHTFVDCQNDIQTTVGNGTHVKPVLLAVRERPGSNHSQSLMAGNFAAL